jgi:hypothetical protein
MRPVRPSGTPTTDSSSAPGEHLPTFVRRSACLPATDCSEPTAERTRHSRMTPVPQPSVTLVTEAPTLTGIDPFVPGSMLLTYPCSKTRDANAGSPRSNRVFFVTDGWFRVPRRVFSPKGAGTRGHSSTSVITTATRARRRRPYPRTTLADRWLGHRQSSLLRAAPNDHPRATTRCRRCPAPLLPVSFARGAHCASCVDCRWETRSRNTSRRRSWRPQGVETPYEQHRHHVRPKDS